MSVKKPRKFTYELLETFCNENEITLLKDYSNENVSGRTNIEGLCKNFLLCKGTFSKNFVRLISNAECHDCARHNRNNYVSQKNHCNANNIELLKDYSNVKLNKLFVIEGKCINYSTCNRTFKKTLNRLFENGYCSVCNISSEHNYPALKKFCDENKITLTKDYSKEVVNCTTVISGYCSNYVKCNNLFNKSLKSLKEFYIQINDFYKIKKT